ncbi:MAG: hypothetical protein Q8K79_18145 [Solirubrobacteraceae bacterium]|nr:hypothetical protein [Solirubrobacteraceae bacterium]
MVGEPQIPPLPQLRLPRVRGPRLRGQILRRAGELASIDGLEQVSIGRLAARWG